MINVNIYLSKKFEKFFIEQQNDVSTILRTILAHNLSIASRKLTEYDFSLRIISSKRDWYSSRASKREFFPEIEIDIFAHSDPQKVGRADQIASEIKKSFAECFAETYEECTENRMHKETYLRYIKVSLYPVEFGYSRY